MSIYYTLILFRCGPPVTFWCMRFEGKHSYFKNAACRVRCFRNITKTLATWHQKDLCYRFNKFSSSQLLKQTSDGPGTCMCKSSILGIKTESEKKNFKIKYVMAITFQNYMYM